MFGGFLNRALITAGLAADSASSSSSSSSTFKDKFTNFAIQYMHITNAAREGSAQILADAVIRNFQFVDRKSNDHSAPESLPEVEAEKPPSSLVAPGTDSDEVTLSSNDSNSVSVDEGFQQGSDGDNARSRSLVGRARVNVYTISQSGCFIYSSIKSWQKGKCLGSGSFGTVYGALADTGLHFAVKEVLRSQGQQSIDQLEQEIALLSQIEHENIVRYLGTDKDESCLYIFLELMTKGSLRSHYQEYQLQDSQVSVYTRQILTGLKYLHERKVVHRDIKCANILVDVSGSVKLADFGLAKETRTNDVNSCKGTACWMAPEVVRGKKTGYGRAADIWSLGCTVLEMLTCQVPYYPLEPVCTMYKIGTGELPPVPDSLSENARDFILGCLKVDPDDRPTAAELLEHPFVMALLEGNITPASPHNSIENYESGSTSIV